MIAFFAVLLVVLIKQYLFLTISCIVVNIFPAILLIIEVVLLILMLIFHYSLFEIIYEKIGLSRKVYNIYWFISWIIVGTFFSYILINAALIWRILPSTLDWFSGLEYIVPQIFLILYLIIISILEIIKFIISKKNNKFLNMF